MAQRIVLLSGSISAGKTALATNLRRHHNAAIVKTRQLLDVEATHRFLSVTSRAEYQALGESLDVETNGRWVSNALSEILRKSDAELIVVDAVRIPEQIRSIREEYGFSVFHIHLTASLEDLQQRFNARNSEFKEAASFEEARANLTEANIELLEKKADAVVNTSLCTPEDVLVRVATHLHLYSRDYTQLVDVVIGGQFGSEGKGHIASFLAREYDILVRTGGPNAGHKVYETPDPFTHHHLPCGTRGTQAKLLIAPGAVVNPKDILQEISACNVDPDRLAIDPQVMIITNEDREAEGQLVRTIGSTGMGVGAATARRIMGRSTPIPLARDYPELSPYVRDTAPLLERAYSIGERILLEGTQGTGLSLYHGKYPHVTSRDTSVAACLSEAGIPPKRVRKVVMVCRTYPIRVQDAPEGTSGNLSREICWDEVAKRSHLSAEALRSAEITSTTGRSRRVSEFDWVQLKRAAAINGPTDIALTFADYITASNKDARRFEQLSEQTIQFIEEVENVAAAPVSLISTRFEYRSIIDRRNW